MLDPFRSYKLLTLEDLDRLRAIAIAGRQEFFARGPRCAALSNRVLCVALCQGAALHWVDGKNGIKDFDVWTFYEALPNVEFPPRWRVERDFGNDKFGQSPDKPEFIGRRVDLLGRSLQVESDADPTAALQAYLSFGKTESARQLAKKAVVLLEPVEQLGKIVWPLQHSNAGSEPFKSR